MLQEGKRIAGKKVIAICTSATEDKSLVLANQINEKSNTLIEQSIHTAQAFVKIVQNHFL